MIASSWLGAVVAYHITLEADVAERIGADAKAQVFVGDDGSDEEVVGARGMNMGEVV